MKSVAIIVIVLIAKEVIDYLYEERRHYAGDSLFYLLCAGFIYFFQLAGVGLVLLAWCERKSKLSQWRFCEGYLNTHSSWANKYFLTDKICGRRHWARPFVLNLVTPFSDGEHLFQILFTVVLCLLMPGNFFVNYLGATVLTIAFKYGFKRKI